MKKNNKGEIDPDEIKIRTVFPWIPNNMTSVGRKRRKKSKVQENRAKNDKEIEKEFQEALAAQNEFRLKCQRVDCIIISIMMSSILIGLVLILVWGI